MGVCDNGCFFKKKPLCSRRRMDSYIHARQGKTRLISQLCLCIFCSRYKIAFHLLKIVYSLFQRIYLLVIVFWKPFVHFLCVSRLFCVGFIIVLKEGEIYSTVIGKGVWVWIWLFFFLRIVLILYGLRLMNWNNKNNRKG